LPKSVASGKLNVDKAVVWWMPVQVAMVIEEVHGRALSSHAARHLDADNVVACGSSYGVTWDLGNDASIGDWHWLMFAPSAFCCGLAWLFASLTVEVSGTDIRWYFGPGLWDYRVALSDIEGVRIVRSMWLNGFGIRVRPGWRFITFPGSTQSNCASRLATSVASAPMIRAGLPLRSSV
jgi:hypothetical protein